VDAVGWFARFGYGFFFAVALAEVLALPIAAAPVLVVAGSLAAWGHLAPLPLLAAVVAGTLAGDAVGYGLGRWRGRAALGWVCRLSLSPERCVAKAQRLFGRWGAAALLAAKFLPGLGPFSGPSAGAAGWSLRRFLALDLVAAALWAATWTGVGYGIGRSVAGLPALFVWATRWLAVLVPALVVAALAARGTRGLVRRARVRRLATGAPSPAAAARPERA
jgi:membrane protein DedA with SNARE-associated domain